MVRIWITTALSVVLLLRSTPVWGGRGYSLSFQGPGKADIMHLKNGFIDFEDPGMENLSENMTITFWARAFDHPTSSMMLYISWANAFDQNFMQPFLLQRKSGGYLNQFQHEFPDNIDWSEWHFFVFTIEQGNARIILDQTQIFVKTFDPPFRVDAEKTMLGVGGHMYTGIDEVAQVREQYGFWGEMDDFSLWSRALNDTELEVLRKTPLHEISATVREDLLLAYTFDATDCDVQVAGAFKDYSCSLFGEKIARNLGFAGEKYDMVLGQVSNVYGFGKSYLSIEASNGLCTALKEFGLPRAMPSSLPEPIGAKAKYAPEVPVVTRCLVGGQVDVPLSVHADFKVSSLLSQPPVGSLRYLNGSLVALGANLSAVDELVFSFDATWPVFFNDDYPAAISGFQVSVDSLDGAELGLVQAFHVLPLLEPKLLQEKIVIDVVAGRPRIIRLNTFAFSTDGDPLQAVIESLPSSGTLSQIEWSTDDELGPITSPNTPVDHLAGGVLYSHDESSHSASQTASFLVHFISKASGLKSSTLRVAISIIPTLKIPIMDQEEVATVEEDDSQGIWIHVDLQDKLQRAGMTVKTLPQKGDLFVERTLAGSNKTQLLAVNQGYQVHDAGYSILSQYVKSVRKFSSWWGGGLDSGYHVLNVIGSPQCIHQNAGECSRDDRLTYDKDLGQYLKPVLVGDLIRVNRFQQNRSKDPLYVMAFVRAVYQDDMDERNFEYDVETHPLFRLIDGEFQPCILNGPNFPEECDPVSQVESPVLRFEKVKRTDLEMVKHGTWCPRQRVFEGNETFKSGPEQAAYGTQYMFTHNQADLYEREGMGKPYTEFVEVEFEQHVFPISLEVGSSRGGGSIVNIKALDPNGKWELIYSDRSQWNKYKDTNGVGNFFLFDERICRSFFKTKVIRLELDTSMETGITDWNYIDYVRLDGALNVQSSILEYPVSNRIKYVPREDEFGSDEFELEAFRCGGSFSQGTNTSTKRVEILPKPDPPEISVSTDGQVETNPFFIYNSESFFGGNTTSMTLTFDITEHEFENVTFTFKVLPTFGEIFLLEDDVSTPLSDNWERELQTTGTISKHSYLSLVYRPQKCQEQGFFSPEVKKWSFSVIDNIVVQVTDSSGLQSTLEVPLEVVCEDFGFDSTVKTLCLALSGVNIAFGGFCFVWSIVHRNTMLVRAAQLPFLLLIAMGAIISSSAIIPLTVDDSQGPRATEEGGNLSADMACNAAVTLYMLGFITTFASLFAKMYRIDKLFHASGFHGNKPQVGVNRIVSIICTFVAIEMILIAFKDTMVYKRTPQLLVHKTFSSRSSGYCSMENTFRYFTLVAMYHGMVLLYASYICYRTFGINSAFSEAKYVSVSIFSNLQVLVVAIPVLIITRDSPSSSLFIQATAIAINDGGVLCFIFLPKLYYHRYSSQISIAGIGGEIMQRFKEQHIASLTKSNPPSITASEKKERRISSNLRRPAADNPVSENVVLHSATSQTIVASSSYWLDSTAGASCKIAPMER